MNDKLENLRSELDEASDELDQWAERTGAKIEGDAATAGRRLGAIRTGAEEHLGAARERVRDARTRGKARAEAKMAEAKARLKADKAELKKVADEAVERADEGKAKFLL